MVHYKIIFAFLLSFCVSMAVAQQYTPMTAAGYAMKRVKVDSTLHLPSFCGVPTLRNSTAINGALAMDTCNNKLYKWTNQSGWSTVGDMQDIQSVLDNGETAFGREIDLYNNSGNNELLLSPKYDNGMPFIGMADSVGKYFWISLIGKPNLNFSNKNKTQVLIQQDSIGGIVYLPTQNGETDTLATLGDVRGVTFDTTSLSNRINLKVNIADTASMLTPYFNKVNYGLSKSGQTISADSATLSLKYLRIVDTLNKWVSSVTKLNDSTIQVIKDGTTTNITLTPASTVTSATRLVTQVYNNSGVTITKGSVIYINGRHSSNLPTIALAQANTEQNSYSTFALVLDDIATSNSGTVVQAGSITNLNLPTSSFSDGELVYLSPTVAGGITVTKPLAPYHIVKIGTITRAHPTFGTIELKIENGWQLDELSDVQIPVVPNDSNLLQFSRVDSLWHSVSPTTAIGNRYIKPSDTTAMLSPYQRANDAVTLSTTQTITGRKTFNPSVTASSSVARGTYFTPSLTAAANGDALVGLDILPTYINGAFTSVENLAIRTESGNIRFNQNISQGIRIHNQTISSSAVYSGFSGRDVAAGSTTNWGIMVSANGNFLHHNSGQTMYWNLAGAEKMRLSATNGNLLINTTIDAGYKLDVNGTTRLNGNVNLLADAKIQVTGNTPNIQFGSTGLFNGNWVTQNGKFRINSSGYNAPTYPFSIGNSSQTAASGIAKIAEIGGTLVAAANNDVLVNTDISPTFTNGAFTGVSNLALRTVTGNVIFGSTSGSVGIGPNTSISSSAILDLTSTTKGFLPPRMTTTQRDAILSPAAGLIIYDTTVNKVSVYNGTAWKYLLYE